MDEPVKIDILNHKGIAVADLTVPELWERGKKPPRPGYLMASKFWVSPRDNRIGFTLREPAKKTYHFLTAQENPFLQLLRRPAHPLNPTEIANIHLILDQIAWPAKFQMDWAKTVQVYPSNVLQVQGVWLQENVKSRVMLIDTTFDTANLVQEVWFTGPPDRFEEYVPECDRLFGSLTWKVSVDQMRPGTVR